MKWHEKPKRKVNQARQAPRVVFSPSFFGCYFSVQSGVEIKTTMLMTTNRRVGLRGKSTGGVGGKTRTGLNGDCEVAWDMTMIFMSRDGGGGGHHHCRTEYWRKGERGVCPKKV